MARLRILWGFLKSGFKVLVAMSLFQNLIKQADTSYNKIIIQLNIFESTTFDRF